MTEQTTLLLVHIGESRYRIDRVSTDGRLIADEVRPHAPMSFDDLQGSLTVLGWEIEDDQEEGTCRRLLLTRS